MLSCHSSFRGPHPKKKETAQLLTADLLLQFLASCYHVIPASAALILRKKKPDNFSQQISFAIPCCMSSCHSSFRIPASAALVKKKKRTASRSRSLLQFLASCYHVIRASAAIILRKKKPDSFSQQISFAIPGCMLSCHSSFRGPHPKKKETAQLLTADLLLQFLASCYHVI